MSSINIQEKAVLELLKNQISERILSSIGGTDKMLAAIIDGVLSSKVKSNGFKAESYEQGTPYVQYLCENAMREAAQEVLKEWTKNNAPILKEAIRKEMESRMPEVVSAMFEWFTLARVGNFEFKVKTAHKDIEDEDDE